MRAALWQTGRLVWVLVSHAMHLTHCFLQDEEEAQGACNARSGVRIRIRRQGEKTKQNKTTRPFTRAQGRLVAHGQRGGRDRRSKGMARPSGRMITWSMSLLQSAAAYCSHVGDVSRIWSRNLAWWVPRTEGGGGSGCARADRLCQQRARQPVGRRFFFVWTCSCCWSSFLFLLFLVCVC